MWNLTKPSRTVTSTGKHMKDDKDFDSDTLGIILPDPDKV